MQVLLYFHFNLHPIPGVPAGISNEGESNVASLPSIHNRLRLQTEYIIEGVGVP